MNIKIKLTDKLILKIEYDEDSYLIQENYESSFENVKIYHENKRYSHDITSHGFWNFWQENEAENENEFNTFTFFPDKNKTYYFCDINDSRISIGDKIDFNYLYSISDLENSYILEFNNGEFGENEEQSLKNWQYSINCLVDGEVYYFQLVELEECNLGHEHENIIESVGGFYGFKNESEMILEMINHCIDKKEITYFDDLRKYLDDESFASLKLNDLF